MYLILEVKSNRVNVDIMEKMNIKPLLKNILKAVLPVMGVFTVIAFLALDASAQAYVSALGTYYREPSADLASPYNCDAVNTTGLAQRSFVNSVLQSVTINYFQNNGYDIDDPRSDASLNATWSARPAPPGLPISAPIPDTQAFFTNTDPLSALSFNSTWPNLSAHIAAVNRQAYSEGVGSSVANSKFACSLWRITTDPMAPGPVYTYLSAQDCTQNISIPRRTGINTYALHVGYTDTYRSMVGFSDRFPPIGGLGSETYNAVNGRLSAAQTISLNKATALEWQYDGHIKFQNTPRYTINYVYSDGVSSDYASDDPFKVSSLIEFDLPHNHNDPISTFNNNSYVYPNHCLEICITVRCQPELWQGSNEDYNASGMPTFPLQKVTFEIFKFLEQRNPLSPDDSPAIRTIEIYPDPKQGRAECYGFAPCSSTNAADLSESGACSEGGGPDNGFIEDTPEGKSCLKGCGYYRADGATVNRNATGDACLAKCLRQQEVTFCAPWSGEYNFDSEFAKSNGTFGFRGRVETEFAPPPMQSEEPIVVDNTGVYPGRNQVPIQVDVTNVHTVRATSTVVGVTSKVAAKPYLITYRLSKDSKVKMRVLDANVKDETLFAGSNVIPSEDFIDYPNSFTCANVSTSRDETTACDPLSTECTQAIVRRTLVDGADKIGENPPDGGQVPNTQATVEMEPFNGLDDSGKFLPSGNYLVSIQAKSTDEWGIDMSRVQETQISLDPLKFTDVIVSGLNKDSTAYAQVGYFLTEPATVHIEVHKPGTTFGSLYTPYDSTYYTSGGPSTSYLENGRPRPQQNNTLVYTATEQKAGRTSVSTKWDGICNLEPNNADPAPGASGCTHKGQPMPDGDYVLIMWAEMPYGDVNGAPAKYLRGDCAVFDAVRTTQYYNTNLPVERGVVDITIQPVGYSTIGSSPTAYGLDPFMFRYSISREAPVTAVIKDTEGKHIVKTLVNSEVQVAQQMNVYSWNGIDDQGRYVAPGIYMFEVTTRDPLFPNDPDKTYVQNALFPVDMFRILDVTDTALQGENNGRATVAYTLSKSMDVQLIIFDKGTVIPTPSVIGNQNNWTISAGNELWGQICSYPGDYPFEGKGCIYNPDTVAVPPATYPGTRQDPITGTGIPVALQPVKYFKQMVSGEGKRITESWDGYSALKSSIVPDGKYPYMIKGASNEPANQYYEVDAAGQIHTLYPAPKPLGAGSSAPMYATDKPTGYITIARGSVYFLDDSIKVDAYNPALYHSTGTIHIPIYTIEFALSRVAEVNITIVATELNGCGPGIAGGAGTICRYLTKSVSSASSDEYKIFEAVSKQSVFWDGKNEQGNYVKPGAFEVHFQANGYPATDSTLKMSGGYETEEIRLLNANIFQVFDLFLTDIKPDTPNGLIQYQTSFPGKVAIQIFKPETRLQAVSTNGGLNTRIDLINPATGKAASSDQEVLVKAIVGIRPPLTELTESWNGLDYALQNVPDGTYPFRFVTAIDAQNVDSVTGSIVCANPDAATQCQEYVADWNIYSQLQYIIVSRGDANFVCSDWESANIFYPNPFRSDNGTFEITKLPVPGEYSLKIYNLAGDLIRTKGFPCIDRRNNTITLSDTIRIEPDQNVAYYNNQYSNVTSSDINIRNAELKCTWDKKNDAGKKVARGVYFAIADFKGTQGGAEHCQKVMKILIP